MVEITMDSFVETLERLREYLYQGEKSESAWRLFLGLVSQQRIDLSAGPLDVLKTFFHHAEIVEKDEYEKKYPEYSKVMTWDEFIGNECLVGNDESAIVEIGE